MGSRRKERQAGRSPLFSIWQGRNHPFFRLCSFRSSCGIFFVRFLILFSVFCFLFPVPCSLFPVPCSLFPVPCSLFPVPSARPFCLSAVFFPSLAFHPRWLSLPPYSGSPPHRCDVLSGRRDRPGKPGPTQKRRLCIRFRISAQTRGFRIRTIPVKTVI